MGEEKKVTKYRLKKSLFPNGTILEASGVTKHEAMSSQGSRLFQVIIGADKGLHKDHTIGLYVHEDTILANPEFFEPVEE